MKFSPDNNITIKTLAPTIRRTCSNKDVSCIDDCSFLCVENDAKCIAGKCQVEQEIFTKIPCNTETGGILMMVNDPVPHWSCICTNSTFYRGEDCSTLNKDVCEEGVFLYKDQKNYLCLCLPPYELVMIGIKPHCVEKAKIKFVESM